MKLSLKLPFILFQFIICSYSFAQEGKYTPKLRELFQAEQYYDILTYKIKKEDKMSSGSLFYKGLAYFMIDNDREALEYFEKAIQKGPADALMYYYKASALYYLKRYEDALISYDLAIKKSPDEAEFYLGRGYALYQLERYREAKTSFLTAEGISNNSKAVYAALGSVCFDLEQYDEAIVYLQKAMSLNDKRSDVYKGLSFNLGLVYQQSKQYEKAYELYQEHIFIFSKDYHAHSKFIQSCYALERFDDSKESEALLIEASKANELPSYMRLMFCFDQFEWQEQNVLAYSSYGDSPKEVWAWKYKFFLEDMDEDSSFKIMTVLDSVQLAAGNGRHYYFIKIESDTLYRYDLSISEDEDYLAVKSKLLAIMNESEHPIESKGDYAAWFKAKKTEKLGEAGLSFETAIVVDNISEEYQWVRDNYPDLTFTQQALVSNENSYFDILYYRDGDGQEYKFYFNINNFFGKY